MTPLEAVLLYGVPVFMAGYLVEPAALKFLRRLKGTQ